MIEPPEVRMGNDIARQFAHLPADEAAAAIAAHVDKFWPPPLRTALRERAAAGEDDLAPTLAAAAGRLA